MARVSRRAQSGLSFPYGFNDCEVLFPPKGSRDGDVVEVVRSESETRPLKCKNSDNKIIAGERNRAIAKIVAKGASTLQNGFIRGMDFLNNVVAIDTFARYASLKSDPNDFPLIVLFNLLNAFPSVLWDWLNKSLLAHGAGPDFAKFVASLYLNVRAFITIGGKLSFACEVTAGVLQGCPLSDTLFVVAMSPFLFDFSTTLVDRSYAVIHACVDDLGTAVMRIDFLEQLARVYKVMSAVAGLCLQVKKCVIVPWVPFTVGNVDIIRAWILKFLPNWSHFKICECGEYLGFAVGPGAGVAQYSKVAAAAFAKVAAIVASAAHLSVATFS